MKYETRAGQVSESDTFMRMIEHLRKAQEDAYTIGHLKKANGDELIGQGFLAIGEMLKMMVVNVTRLATKGKLQ